MPPFTNDSYDGYGPYTITYGSLHNHGHKYGHHTTCGLLDIYTLPDTTKLRTLFTNNGYYGDNLETLE